jgi:hypothetical protein
MWAVLSNRLGAKVKEKEKKEEASWKNHVLSASCYEESNLTLPYSTGMMLCLTIAQKQWIQLTIK